MTNPFHDRLDAIDASDTPGFHGGRLAATVLLLRDGDDGLEAVSYTHLTLPTKA